MPLQKRIVYDPAAYHNKDVFEESSQDTFLQDNNMSRMLGAMQQLAYFSSFSLEILQNLSLLTEDLNDRIKSAVVRTNNLYGSLQSVDRQVASIDDHSHVSAVSGMAKYLQSREMFTPQLFNKATNYSAVSQQYRICRAPPQLWRIEMFTDEECFRNYSNPGFFFQEWVRSEIMRQKHEKDERKRNKLLKRQQRQERKKLKEAAAEEELYNTMYSAANAAGNASANVSLSGVTDKRNKSMLQVREKRQGYAGFGDTIEESEEHEARQNSLEEKEQEHKDAVPPPATAKEKTREIEAKKPTGLAKLFGRKPKNLFPEVDEEVPPPDPPSPVAPRPDVGMSKTESLSLQLLGAQEMGNRGAGATSAAAADLHISDDETTAEQEAAHYNAKSTKPAARPPTYMDELNAAAVVTRRHSVMARDRESGLHEMLQHSSASAAVFSEEIAAAVPHQPLMETNFNYSAAQSGRRNKNAPVTMKIGNKFLSSTVSGGKKSKTAAPVTSAAKDSAEEYVPHQTIQRRGSSRGNRVLEDHPSVPQQQRQRVDSADWETQRRGSIGHLLLKPAAAEAVPAAAERAQSKRASFASDRHNSFDETDNKLLNNKSRHSFILPQSSLGDVFGRGSRARSTEDEEAAMMGDSSMKRRSLLSMLEDEVLEDLGGANQHRTASSRVSIMDTSVDVEEEDLEEDDVHSEDELDIEEDDVIDDIEEGEAGDDEDEPPSDDEIEDEDAGSPPESDIDEEPEENPRVGGPAVCAGGPPPPPPPPPPPAATPAPPLVKSALGQSLLGALRGESAGASLRKVEAPAEARVDDRTHLLRSIQLGTSQLKSAEAAIKAKTFQKIEVKVSSRLLLFYLLCLTDSSFLFLCTAKRSCGSNSC